MKATGVEIVNLIPVLSGKATNVEPMTGSTEQVLNSVRASCGNPGTSLVSWANTIEKHLPIPANHPFQVILSRLKPGDPLRILGAWAYGSETGWITIERIEWDDGTISSPQADHRAWLQRSMTTART